MNQEIYAGTAIGMGALGAGIFTTNYIRRKWREFIEREVVRQHGERPQTHVTPHLIADIVHEKFDKDIREIRSRLVRIETAALEAGNAARAIAGKIDRPVATPFGVSVPPVPKPPVPKPASAPISSLQAQELWETYGGGRVGSSWRPSPEPATTLTDTEPQSRFDVPDVQLHMGDSMAGNRVSLNLAALVQSRLLITATSGSGKSWSLRRLIEQASQHVHLLILDPEGEFASLKDKLKISHLKAESAQDVARAGVLAIRLMASKESAVLDISNLNPESRVQFVKRFVQSLVEVKEELRHPVMVVIDEAQLFAPQGAAVESSAAIKDLLTRGRKRGQFAVLATQRLSNIDKTVAAQCDNVMIGRATLDIDVRRGLETLGVGGKDDGMLRGLEVGQFYCNGTAFGADVVQLCKVGTVVTSHPKMGVRA